MNYPIVLRKEAGVFLFSVTSDGQLRPSAQVYTSYDIGVLTRQSSDQGASVARRQEEFYRKAKPLSQTNPLTVR